MTAHFDTVPDPDLAQRESRRTVPLDGYAQFLSPEGLGRIHEKAEALQRRAAVEFWGGVW